MSHALSAEFKSRFIFNKNLADPIVWEPGPKTYPSQNAKARQGQLATVFVIMYMYMCSTGLYMHTDYFHKSIFEILMIASYIQKCSVLKTQQFAMQSPVNICN